MYKLVGILVAGAVLAGCSEPIAAPQTPGSMQSASLPRPLAFTMPGQLWTAGRTINTYQTFGGTAIRSIAGSNTGIAGDVSIVVTAKRGSIVADGAPAHGSVSFFAPNATGNVAPTRQIDGTSTTFTKISAMTVDSAGNIYVGFSNAHNVVVFKPTAKGNVAPVRTIVLDPSPSSTVMTTGLLVSGNKLYVSTWSPDRVTVFAAGTSSANNKPLGYIQGNNTQIFWHPQGMAFDSQGYFYVALRTFPGVAVYKPGASGDIKPSRILQGSEQLAAPNSIAIDSHDNLYVLDEATQREIYVYPPGSNNTDPYLAKVAVSSLVQAIAWHK